MRENNDAIEKQFPTNDFILLFSCNCPLVVSYNILLPLNKQTLIRWNIFGNKLRSYARKVEEEEFIKYLTSDKLAE